MHHIHNIAYGDSASKSYIEWVTSLTGTGASAIDTLVLSTFTPPVGIVGTLSCPKDDVVMRILEETNSIVMHCGFMSSSSSSRELPKPLVSPPTVTSIREPGGLVSVFEFLSHPREDYPVIFGLKKGMYVCDVVQVWGNAVVVITVFRG
ncbi:hypothetical protein HDU76_008945 [Blyttiomyces sp. JEL0837]|nr:hypothetical protein HDU76_008945 [Blyttiomyces sp. JEL0837]